MRIGIVIPIAVGVVVAGLVIVAAVRAKRRREVPELNKHPERLEQMLDPTDDA